MYNTACNAESIVLFQKNWIFKEFWPCHKFSVILGFPLSTNTEKAKCDLALHSLGKSKLVTFLALY